VVALEPVATGLENPLYITHAGDDRLMIVEQPGRMRIWRDGILSATPFLDITALVNSSGNEQGFLGVAFHPHYAVPGAEGAGLFWVNYTDLDGHTVVARYSVSADNPDLADPGSARILLTIFQPFANHNGGQLLFGPQEAVPLDPAVTPLPDPDADLPRRRYLYIGMGDGGGAGDSDNHAQRDDTLLGKMLRIDPSTALHPTPPFSTVPPDNPYVGAAPPLDTIWAKGLRNPWRFSFDAELGDLYIADVGQGAFEELHVTLQGTPGGVNYGWRIMEGLACFNSTQDCDKTGLELPVLAYAHEQDRCAIVGGYVYRGIRFPALLGTYVFADYCSAELFTYGDVAPGQKASQRVLIHTALPLSFGEDVNGEVYLGDRDGNIS
jgi:glucose/arabinose dehydrogenase